MKIIEKIKEKREFSELPNSIVNRVMAVSDGSVKESRSLLRKYFGVFLTNRILKGKNIGDKILKIHLSSKKRDYIKFYEEIFVGIEGVRSIIDLGCGVGGFSYGFLRESIGDVDYVGVEAVGQLVEQTNEYFQLKKFSAIVLTGDLFNIDIVLNILRKQKRKRIVFLFQVIDALENLEKNFSKKFILEISKECEGIVLSLPTESLGGRKKFAVRRKWLVDFLEEKFFIKRDFILNGERILYFVK